MLVRKINCKANNQIEMWFTRLYLNTTIETQTQTHHVHIDLLCTMCMHVYNVNVFIAHATTRIIKIVAHSL